MKSAIIPNAEGGDAWPSVAAAPRLTTLHVLVIATACGLSVANIHYAHPLLNSIASDFSIGDGSIGFVVGVTQIGFALGLVLIAPLGDFTDRRRLVAVQALLSALALAGVGLAPQWEVLLACFGVVGLFAVTGQLLVAFAAALARPEKRGSVIGAVTAGVVIGIVSARVVAGVLADAAGWRSVYLCSAGLTLAMAGLLFRILPRDVSSPPAPTYPALLRSSLQLFRTHPVLRVRGVIGLLAFAAFNVLWAALSLPLSAPPHSLSHTEIGLLGLAGLVGAYGAARAGRSADRGFGQRTTGLSLTLLVAAWLPISLLGPSLWVLVVGVVIVDFAVQSVHATNQVMTLSLNADARSRLAAGYMVFFSVGSAFGSIASTMVYERVGWLGVCGLGAALSLSAFFYWAWSRPGKRSASSQIAAPEARWP